MEGSMIKRKAKKRAKKRPRGKCGAKLARGKTCQRVAGWGTSKKSGPCKPHTAGHDAMTQDRKRAFLEIYSTGTSVEMAARMCDGFTENAKEVMEAKPDEVWHLRKPRGGVDPATVWRWAQADSEFKVAYEAARALVDDMRPTMVEDMLFERLMAGKENGTTAIRWLERRSRERWRPPTKDLRINPKEELAKLLGCSPEELPDRLDEEAA